jgi:hypothetical protein
MAILQGMCSSFKQESWQGIHNLPVDTIKLALYTASADLSQATTVYTSTGEVSGSGGSGYPTEGVVLSNVQVLLSGTTAYVTFDNPVLSGVSFVCRGGLIYNASKANRAIAVLDFGADKTASGTFTIQMPAATATTALLRFA